MPSPAWAPVQGCILMQMARQQVDRIVPALEHSASFLECSCLFHCRGMILYNCGQLYSLLVRSKRTIRNSTAGVV
jgi:hypothetical protein